MELRGDRARTFVQLRQLLARGIVTGGDAEELTTGITKLFRAQAAVITQGFTFADWNVAIDVPAAWPALYMQHCADDPSRDLLAETTGETYLIDRDSTRAQKECPLFFHLHDQGLQDGLISKLYNPFINDVVIAIYRANGQRAFSEDDAELFRIFYPHLAGGLAARRALAALDESPRETLPALLTRLDGHVYLSFPSGAITWSAKARELWGTALEITGDTGWARAESVLRASAIQFHAPMIGGRSHAIAPGIRIEWACVPSRTGERRRMLGIMLAEESSAFASPLEALLTPRQRHVARAAIAGQTAREIADSLSISTETVRWTLREIYRRLGVRTRAALATTLAGPRRS